MYNDTNSNNHGPIVYCSFERTDIIQITNITFYYNRYSDTKRILRSMGRLLIQLILPDGQWSSNFMTKKVFILQTKPIELY